MPWVSALLMVLMVFGFLVSGMGTEGSGRGEKVADKAFEIAEFLVDHPYLDTPPQLTVIFGPEFLDQKRRAKGRYLAENAPPSAAVLARDQRQLEDLVESLGATTGDLTTNSLGFVPARPSPLAAVTYMFLHGGWLHLVGNLLFFFIVGPYLEDVYGRVVFVLLFFVSGGVAALAHAWKFPDTTAPLIGASGAIAGIMGAYLFRLGGSRIAFLFLPVLFLPFWRYRFHAPAFIVLPLWFVEQLAEAHQEASSGTGVAYWAHIGGFAFGAAVALVLKVTGLEKSLAQEISAAVPAAAPEPARAIPAPRAVSGALPREMAVPPPGRSGTFPRAAVPAPAPAVPVQTAEAAIAGMGFDLEKAYRAGDGAAANQIAERLLAAQIRSGDTESAFALVREMKKRCAEGPSARFGLAAAAFLESQDDPSNALAHYIDVAKRNPSDVVSLRALIKIAELKARLGDVRSARVAIEYARKHPRHAPEWDALIDTAISRGQSRPSE